MQSNLTPSSKQNSTILPGTYLEVLHIHPKVSHTPPYFLVPIQKFSTFIQKFPTLLWTVPVLLWKSSRHLYYELSTFKVLQTSLDLIGLHHLKFGALYSGEGHSIQAEAKAPYQSLIHPSKRLNAPLRMVI
jgi:hypothetical protein